MEATLGQGSHQRSRGLSGFIVGLQIVNWSAESVLPEHFSSEKVLDRACTQMPGPQRNIEWNRSGMRTWPHFAFYTQRSMFHFYREIRSLPFVSKYLVFGSFISLLLLETWVQRNTSPTQEKQQMQGWWQMASNVRCWGDHRWWWRL